MIITWGMLPLAIKINTIVGAFAFGLCLVPRLFKWPKVLLPAFIFFESVATLVVWGVINS